uniref:Uncharacterized protein n=1 Tax=Rhizophora mucronata TaxID=61149 RepID=A0A2P2Q4R7_RHIMU
MVTLIFFWNHFMDLNLSFLLYIVQAFDTFMTVPPSQFCFIFGLSFFIISF